MPVSPKIGTTILKLADKTLGLLAIKPHFTFQTRVWFDLFCRHFLELFGWMILVISATEVEYLIREVLTNCTYKFKDEGLQFLKISRVHSPF